MNKKFNLEKSFCTAAVHGGWRSDPATGSSALPIYQTAAYEFPSVEDAADRFSLESSGNIYSRLTNPTVDTMIQRLAILEGATMGVAVGSGHAAEMLAFLNLLQTGDSVVSSNSLYGGTWDILLKTFEHLGITARFVESNDIKGFAEASDETTKLWFAETIGNPRLDVVDIEALSKEAKASNIPLIIDNTFASPYLCRPIEKGANVVIESLTKWIGGHGTTMGGGIFDGGNFDFEKDPDKFPLLAKPDDSYHGLIYSQAFGNQAFGARIKTQLLRDFGSALSPFNAQQIMYGIDTLALRMERHSENALAVARYLEAHPKVKWVSYPGLKSHPSHDVAKRMLTHGFGGCVVFGVKGGRSAGQKVIENCKLFYHLANVGDTRSLIIHPASTTHSQLNAEEMEQAGLSEDLIRLSIGIENVSDIIDDLEQALDKI